MTHDYKRHGTTTLFAALNILEGTLIGRCMARHRHQEFIRFLNAIEAAVPAGKVVHVILDNYGTHKHPKVRAWLARHPRFAFHFTPTSCSWLNAIETFFAKLTRRRLKRGVFRSIVDLQAAINRFIEAHNHDPKPFVWTADPNRILESVRRGIKRWRQSTSDSPARSCRPPDPQRWLECANLCHFNLLKRATLSKPLAASQHGACGRGTPMVILVLGLGMRTRRAG